MESLATAVPIMPEVTAPAALLGGKKGEADPDGKQRVLDCRRTKFVGDETFE